MMTLSNTTLHFQSSFQLRSSAENEQPWTTLAKTIRSWIQQAPRDNPPQSNMAFGAAWFFMGGEWAAPGPGYHFVKTVRHIGNGNDREPQHWAVRYEHNCSEPGRVWRVDIGITRLEPGIFRFSISTSYYMRSGFIGIEPQPPLPTAPGIVGWLLKSEDWTAYAGSERLRSMALPLVQGQGMQFKSILEDPNRQAPIVLVSRDFRTGEFLLDPQNLGWLLAGAASVYEASSSGLDKELEWCLGARFSCWNGMVRVYQPGMSVAAHSTAKRQRYFSGRQILELGTDTVVETLVRGIARRAEPSPVGCIASIEGVAALEREARLAELKATAGESNQGEWIALLEETNAALQKEVNDRDSAIQRLKNENADSADKVAKLEYDKKALQARFAANDLEAQSLKSRADAASSIDALPETLSEVISLICRIYPDRIAFSENGVKSAEDCNFDDVQSAWKAFRAMATHLHDIFFGEDGKPGDIEGAFYERSAFRLAMTEGGMTKDDNRLMRKREDTFLGVGINITPHVKIDKNTTRAYFSPCEISGKKLIVVGFVGHMDTAGTRRMK
jgi:hypothetical protein